MTINVDVLFGGQSPEQSISVISARNVVSAMMSELPEYQVRLVYIDLAGNWYISDDLSILLESDSVDKARMIEVMPSVVPVKNYYLDMNLNAIPYPDVFLPIIHGPNCEDGKIQAVLELSEVPFAGCGVLAGAVTMDKEIMKQLFKAADVPMLPYQSYSKFEWEEQRKNQYRDLVTMKLPYFVKPCSMGSSIGITKVSNMEELTEACELAFEYDHKIVIEEGRLVREIEIGMMGDFDKPDFSEIGEIVTKDQDFYDFEKKYESPETQLCIPAELSEDDRSLIQEYALKVTRIFNLRGISRIDFFKCRETGQIWINEINSIPGFTKGSMYPCLWKNKGLGFSGLIDKVLKNSLKKSS